jgi:hypothetical protein
MRGTDDQDNILPTCTTLLITKASVVAAIWKKKRGQAALLASGVVDKLSALAACKD